MEASSSYAPLAFLAAAPSNYTLADRPYSNLINKVVIHVTQGSWTSAINWFQNPVSAMSSSRKFRGMKRAGAVSVPGPQDAVSAAKPLDNTPHLFAVVGAKRDGPNGSHRRCDLQQMGADGLVVRCLEDNYHVVGTDGPVGLLQLHPVLVGHIGTTVGSGDGIPYVFDALVGVVHQTDVSGHRACAPFLPFTPKHQWCLQMKRASKSSHSRKLRNYYLSCLPR